MSFRLSSESIKSLQRINGVRQTLAQIVVEMDDDSALAKTLEEAALSEEQILNIQKLRQIPYALSVPISEVIQSDNQ